MWSFGPLGAPEAGPQPCDTLYNNDTFTQPTTFIQQTNIAQSKIAY